MENSNKFESHKEYQKMFFKECVNKGNFSGDITAKIIKDLSKKYIGHKVLDVGAGSGSLIDLIPQSIGLDLTSKHSKVIEGDIAKMSFSNESFETVFASEVLEHLDNETLEMGLREIYRILKPGGYFVITTPYNEDLKENMVICPKCGEKFHRRGHIQSFNRERTRILLEENNFKIIIIKVLPLALIARCSLFKYFYILLGRLNLIRTFNLFVVARKLTNI